jgi:hypothetical protein
MLATVAAKILKRATYTPKTKLTIIKPTTEGSGPRMIDAQFAMQLNDRRCEHDDKRTHSATAPGQVALGG